MNLGMVEPVAPVAVLIVMAKQEGVVVAQLVRVIMQWLMHILFTNCALPFVALKSSIGLQATPPLCPSKEDLRARTLIMEASDVAGPQVYIPKQLSLESALLVF